MKAAAQHRKPKEHKNPALKGPKPVTAPTPPMAAMAPLGPKPGFLRQVARGAGLLRGEVKPRPMAYRKGGRGRQAMRLSAGVMKKASTASASRSSGGLKPRGGSLK